MGRVDGESNYSTFVARVQARVPPHAVVMGGSSLWLAMPDTNMYVPFALPHYLTAHPTASVAEALAHFQPTIYILDDESRQAFARTPHRYDELQIELNQKGTRVDDITLPALGRAAHYQIYQLNWTTTTSHDD